MFTHYNQSAPNLAQDLLWKILVHTSPVHWRLAWRIVETEAYLWKKDPASHGYRRPTPRNRIMFGPAGYVYVYQIYGIHYCFNITSDPNGDSAAILIRALEPVEWIQVMQRLRNKKKSTALCSWPAKLFQAMAMNKSMYGFSMDNSVLHIEHDEYECWPIIETTRIGISKWTDLPLRRYLWWNPHVSVK